MLVVRVYTNCLKGTGTLSIFNYSPICLGRSTICNQYHISKKCVLVKIYLKSLIIIVKISTENFKIKQNLQLYLIFCKKIFRSHISRCPCCLKIKAARDRIYIQNLAPKIQSFVLLTLHGSQVYLRK